MAIKNKTVDTVRKPFYIENDNDYHLIYNNETLKFLSPAKC